MDGAAIDCDFNEGACGRVPSELRVDTPGMSKDPSGAKILLKSFSFFLSLIRLHSATMTLLSLSESNDSLLL